MDRQPALDRQPRGDGWVFFLMITIIIILVAVIVASRLWISRVVTPLEEESSQVFVDVPPWQRQSRNYSRLYDANLIRIAISDFKAKHEGHLPELGEITESKREGDSFWQYTELQQISDHSLVHYEQQHLNTPVGRAPKSDESFYGASASLEQASLPNEDNIHIWLGYTCSIGKYGSYTNVVEKSAISDFAIVYSIENPENSIETDEPVAIELVRCLGEND